MSEGCPVCDWRGEIATTHDSSTEYYTHIIVRDGEIFTGKTCSMRTKPKNKVYSLSYFRWSDE